MQWGQGLDMASLRAITTDCCEDSKDTANAIAKTLFEVGGDREVTANTDIEISTTDLYCTNAMTSAKTSGCQPQLTNSHSETQKPGDATAASPGR
jgi:hypothetical protein